MDRSLDPLDVLTVSVWRGTEEGDYQQFRVPCNANQTVLDIVTYIQQELDPGLAYRFSCRVGVCGSCGVTVNGTARWACRTHVSRVVKKGKLAIGPLKNLPVIRDLVTDMTVFFEKWRAARGRFAVSNGVSKELAKIPPNSKERREADGAIECINCGVCYSTCDVVRLLPGYLGPAALNRAWAAYNDVRDRDRAEVLRAISKTDGCMNCHTHHACAASCPVGLNPTRSIAGLKRKSVEAYLMEELE